MLPPLFEMPCGDWIPIELVTTIICQQETSTRKPHVVVVIGTGKIQLTCPFKTDEEAKATARRLGLIVNEFRETVTELA